MLRKLVLSVMLVLLSASTLTDGLQVGCDSRPSGGAQQTSCGVVDDVRGRAPARHYIHGRVPALPPHITHPPPPFPPQVLAAVAVMSIALVLHVVVRPHTLARLHRLEVLSLVTTLATLYLSLYYTYTPQDGYPARYSWHPVN